jgi:hypothetical protein
VVATRADADQQFCSEAPPKASSATSVMTTVASVLTERVIVCRIEVLTIVSKAWPSISLTFSRIRSRITIVSMIE